MWEFAQGSGTGSVSLGIRRPLQPVNSRIRVIVVGVGLDLYQQFGESRRDATLREPSDQRGAILLAPGEHVERLACGAEVVTRSSQRRASGVDVLHEVSTAVDVREVELLLQAGAVALSTSFASRFSTFGEYPTGNDPDTGASEPASAEQAARATSMVMISPAFFILRLLPAPTSASPGRSSTGRRRSPGTS